MNIVRITFISGQTSLVEVNGLSETIATIANCIEAGTAWEIFCPSGVPGAVWARQAESLIAARFPACTKSFTSALEDQCYEDATIEAAEICGPNGYEYDSLVESISERLFNERSPA